MGGKNLAFCNIFNCEISNSSFFLNLYVLGPHSAMLRGYSWLCTQESLPGIAQGEQIVHRGLNPGQRMQGKDLTHYNIFPALVLLTEGNIKSFKHKV